MEAEAAKQLHEHGNVLDVSVYEGNDLRTRLGNLGGLGLGRAFQRRIERNPICRGSVYGHAYMFLVRARTATRQPNDAQDSLSIRFFRGSGQNSLKFRRKFEKKLKVPYVDYFWFNMALLVCADGLKIS